MKKSSLILSIISAILAVAALLLVWFMPGYVQITGAPLTASNEVFTKVFPALFGLFGLQAYSTNPSSVYFEIGLLVGFLLLNALWIVHLVMLIVKKRPGATAIDVLWIVFGFVDICLGLCAVGQNNGVGIVFESVVGGSNLYTYHDIFGFINAAKPNILVIILLVFPYILGFISFVLGLVGASISLADVIKHPGKKKETVSDLNRKEVITQTAANESTLAAVPSEEELKAAQYRELEEQKGSDPKMEKPNPYIVQNFYYGTAPKMTESGKPVKPGEEPHQDQPLTTKELRKLVEDEIADKVAGDENKPLTAAEARALIAEELQSFTEKVAPAQKAEEPAPVEPQPEETSSDMMTSDDLRKIIKEEITAVIGEKPEEGLKADDVRLIVKEEISALAKSSDALAQSFADSQKALADQDAAEAAEEEKRDSAIAALQGAIVSADQIRSIVADELAKKAEAEKPVETVVIAPEVKEEAPAPAVAAPVSEAAPAPEVVAPVPAPEVIVPTPEAVAPAPAPVTESAPTVEPVEEKPAETVQPVVEETKPAEQAVETPAPEAAPVVEAPVSAPEVTVAPVVEAPAAPAPEAVVVPTVEAAPAATEEPVATVLKPKIIRIPFPTRLLAADQKLQNNYNELKSEALSYGLKTRLSNSGDTFRLHTKTYMKLTVAGKGLKLYFALDPKDFKDSPVPVKNAGSKNIYKEIPAVFKVKSPLSLRRAKELLALACGKDNLVKKEPVPHNWAVELKDYKPQLGGDDDQD